ncbi:hypothetical protein [Bacteroides sedimenti]|uniref:Uncharacterized protein n=1 Tax=Bacteroides sedimenti TaxID=2136147 RepID=A0ABN6ZAF3_9BACE
MKNIKLVILLNLVGILLTSCSAKASIEEQGYFSTMVEVNNTIISKGAYQPGESVSISFNLLNNSDLPIRIQDLTLVLKDLSSADAPIVFEKHIGENINLKSKEAQSLNIADFFTIPATAPKKVYGVSVKTVFEKNIEKTTNASYFRVITDNSTLLSYDIANSKYKGLDIFALTGGMSAEYAVGKTLASFTGGISHSWYTSPEQGPFPVLSTPDFLQRSIKKTVDLYNNTIGVDTKIKTVVIGTGVPLVSYLSTSMSAAFLPIHFLVSANTEFEVQSLVEYSTSKGIPCYATMGYDGSMPNIGVAWIKLLDLPEEYIKFIKDHQVEQVIVCGVGENGIGESYAKKVLSSKMTEKYGAGSVYILYPGYGSDSDIATLTNNIYDFKQLRLSSPLYISDWESGIINNQLTNISNTLKSQTSASAYSLVSDDMGKLYNMSSYLVVKNIKNNEALLKSPYINGVAFNEYLVSHPQYEIYTGYVPFLYWQFTSTADLINNCFTNTKGAISLSYLAVGQKFTSLKFFLNSNYGRDKIKDALINKGVPGSNITIRDQSDNDVWNPTNGMNSPCEKFADDIVSNVGVSKYVSIVKAFTPLSIKDIENVSKQIGGIELKKY